MIVGNRVEIDSSFAYQLSGALVKVFNRKNISFVVGYDTRIDSKTLACTLANGLVRCGAKVFFVNITTCGGVCYAIKHFKATAGVLVTGSEKLFLYNGFKIFNGNGFKISDEQMTAVQYSFFHDIFDYDKMAKVEYLDDYNEIYANYLSSFAENTSEIVIDCAHGSGGIVCEKLKKYINLTSYNDTSNGFDVNFDCGLNNTQYIKDKWNIKIDADGDKLLIISPKGKVLRGDTLTTIFASYYNESLVTNILANNSYLKYLDKKNIKYQLSGIGERRLVDTMLKYGYSLCGEKSGSVIFMDTKTSDCFISALKFLNLKDENIIDEILNLDLVPNLEVKISFDNEKINSISFKNILCECEKELEECGKVIVRLNHLDNIASIYVESCDETLLKPTIEKLKNAMF